MNVLPDGRVIDMVALPSGNRTVKVWANEAKRSEAPPAPIARQTDVQFYVPYTVVHQATVTAAPPDAIWVDVSGSDIAYYGAMCDWWSRGETFAVIEHDIECRPDVIEAFNTCTEPWCMFGYAEMCHPECMEAWRNAIGCTRFRSELIAAVPDAATNIPAELWDWHNMCDGLGNNLRAAGFTHHWHHPPVGHRTELER